MAVKFKNKNPSLTCSRGLPRTKAIVPNKLPNWADKVNFNREKYSRLGAICKGGEEVDRQTGRLVSLSTCLLSHLLHPHTELHLLLPQAPGDLLLLFLILSRG